MFYFVSSAGDVLVSCGCNLSGEDANQDEKKLSLRRYKKWREIARNLVVWFLCGAVEHGRVFTYRVTLPPCYLPVSSRIMM